MSLRHLVVMAVVVAALLGSESGILCGGETLSFPLERAFPMSHRVEMTRLRAHDQTRHRRILQSALGGVVDFSVQGTFDPSLVGLYYTRVQLGSPPKEFYVQIDTGSDVLWVSCASCNGCPTASGLQIQLEFFDPASSSTASLISCSDRRCALGKQSSDTGCSAENQCSYTFQYGDGSGTSGYYVADFIHLDAVFGSSSISNSSAQVIFGCSTYQVEDLAKPDRAVDGIFGFGQQSMSVISQLSSHGIVPNVFSHCLRGSNAGGGVLVLGQIVEPNIVYTPLVPSQPHYNLDLEKILINDQPLPIDPKIFATTNNRGTIVDSGTTLAYLAEEAYDIFINRISQIVSGSARLLFTKGSHCYLSTSSVSDIFPTISLSFAGGASMVLKPEDYLLQQNSIGGSAIWCMGFEKIPGKGITILGDLVLKDKIVVYDLANQRIGWANYDCSTSINVSIATPRGKSEFVNAGQIDKNRSSHNSPFKLSSVKILAFMLNVFTVLGIHFAS
ncbi:unnamed protein product [Cuscuta epithymum]|uniref:Peptidase A1 domain-containing protein n=1 Tax=Cuscuta epithymum TaxID=186058 RepID=A0AAV0DAP9_9ASTE|nr:unnamed protein product [Cuscuta epithymum]CAH9140105.1 unnamed protein product [Cuscuta epithymum]